MDKNTCDHFAKILETCSYDNNEVCAKILETFIRECGGDDSQGPKADTTIALKTSSSIS